MIFNVVHSFHVPDDFEEVIGCERLDKLDGDIADVCVRLYQAAYRVLKGVFYEKKKAQKKKIR